MALSRASCGLLMIVLTAQATLSMGRHLTSDDGPDAAASPPSDAAATVDESTANDEPAATPADALGSTSSPPQASTDAASIDASQVATPQLSRSAIKQTIQTKVGDVLADFKANMQCASWAIAGVFSDYTTDKYGQPQKVHPNSNTFLSAAGYHADIYGVAGGKDWSDQVCGQVKNAVNNGIVGGGEQSFEDFGTIMQGKRMATAVYAFWRDPKNPFSGSVDAGKTALSNAANNCASQKATPPTDLTLWAECIGEQIVGDGKDKPLQYVVVIAASLADTLTINAPPDFGLISMTLTFKTTAITFVALLS